uniref:Uncharacterized protein n=1 Tax=viral metagenome TaxID=1070528 RepID=A0A6C0J7K1_9ZZZZ
MIQRPKRRRKTKPLRDKRDGIINYPKSLRSKYNKIFTDHKTAYNT